MAQRFSFDPASLHSVAGGDSAIDVKRLNIHSLAEAESFMKAYGYDLSREHDVERLWYFYRRSLVLMTDKLKLPMNDIPENFKDRKSLQDLRYLLVFASSRDPNEQALQRWSCAILRCMHVFVHAETDLFSFFAEEIQKQILGPIQNVVVSFGNEGKFYLKSFHKEGHPPVELAGFEVKPFKTSSSTVIKLLAKPDALAMKIFDKLGVRFITNSTFDAFQVIRFLIDENIISFPHIMPDQSSNNIYPVDLFLETCAEIIAREAALESAREVASENAQKMGQAQERDRVGGGGVSEDSQQKKISEDSSRLSADEVEAIFAENLQKIGSKDKLFKKENNFSGQDYRFIKFITRKMITIKQEGSPDFSFFYPFEVQILDYKTFQTIQSGPSEHEAYKERQRTAARERLFPETPL